MTILNRVIYTRRIWFNKQQDPQKLDLKRVSYILITFVIDLGIYDI